MYPPLVVAHGVALVIDVVTPPSVVIQVVTLVANIVSLPAASSEVSGIHHLPTV